MKKTKLLILTLTLAISLSSTQFVATAKQTKEPIVKGVFIDYAKGKGSGKPGGGTGGTATDLSTTFKYSGVHWLSPNVTYRVDQASSGLNPMEALASIQAGFNTWEKEINPFSLPDLSLIVYTYSSSPVTFSGGPKLDGENSVSWGSTPSGSIGVTYYWYARGSKQLVEFDMVLNSGLPWSTESVANAYDVQNIVTHEAGHTLVLGDLYNLRDKELTMYGYGALGETKKRDLGKGDMLGVEKIYPLP